MADSRLFIGWGAVARGREGKAFEVFGETVEYYGRLQQEGRIESFEPVLLDPHGGDLEGFLLVRGSQQQMASLQADPEFERIVSRAQFIVDNVGVVRGYIGDGLARTMGTFQEQVAEFAG
jgi:hypothetical protein